MISVPYNFIPRPHQLQVLQAFDSGVKRLALNWHRRAGKDKVSACLMFREMMRVPGTYYYFFPTYAQGRKALWETDDGHGFKVLDHMPKECLKGGKINTNEMKFETINGSIFRVIGTDEIDSIRGSNPIGCVFSEYAYQDPRAWDAIRPILAINNGWAIFNSTPNYRNHFYDLYTMAERNPDWATSTLQTMWPDMPNYSGILDEEGRKREKASGYTEEDMAREYGASFGKATGGFYYAQDLENAQQQGRIGNYPYTDNYWVDTFWDLGLDDDTVCWFKQIQQGRHIWMDYFESGARKTIEYIQMLKDRGYKYRYHYLPHDGAKRDKRTLNTYFYDFQQALIEGGVSGEVVPVPRTSSIQQDIDAIRDRFGSFYFNLPSTHEGLKKLQNYRRQYNYKKASYEPKPLRDHTKDCADAFRAVLGEDKGRFDEYTNTYRPIEPASVIGSLPSIYD